MQPQLKLYEPPLDDGEEDETPEIPCIDDDSFQPLFVFGFAVLMSVGAVIAAVIWFVP